VKDLLEELVNQMVDRGLVFQEAIAEFEKKFISKVLEKNRGNQTKAAKALGIHRNTLKNKIASYNPSKREIPRRPRQTQKTPRRHLRERPLPQIRRIGVR